MPRGAFGHVTYVTDPEPSPDPLGFLVDVLSRPGSLLLLVGGGVVVLAALGLWMRGRPVIAPWERFVDRAWSYRDLVPWMLRLSFGLVLIGGGLSGVVFAPDVRLPGWPSIILTAVGFLLLVGFAVRAAAVVALVAYAVAVVLQPTLLGIFDVAGGLLAIVLLGPAVPSLDDLLRAAFPSGPGARLATKVPSRERYGDLVPLLVRVGLGGAFIASGILDKLLIYERGLATVEKYSLTSVIPVDAGLWVVGAGLVETALGVAILAGFATRLSAMVGFAVLTLTLFGLPDDPVIAHVGLFGSCSVLVVLGAGRWSVDGWLARRGASDQTANGTKTKTSTTMSANSAVR
jgi:uncharacterized membrane protein YphA (DoxX/SURF4 family)